MSEFTPGPWRQGNTVELLLNNKCREIISDDGNIGLVYGIIDQDNKANANLIAAAPELYEALDTLTLVIGLTPVVGNKTALQEAVDVSRAALKKAGGERMSEQIEPGDGWRLLGPDEPVKFADEYFSNATGAWHPIAPGVYGWHAEAFIKVRRRIPAKPEAMEIDDGFRVELGNNLDHFAILQAGPPDSAGDVVIGNAIEARQLADWLTHYAEWREAQDAAK